MKNIKLSRKIRLLPLTQMNETQQLLFKLLSVGDKEQTFGPSTNLSRNRLVSLLNVKDSNARQLIKSMLPYVPVVASKGYFIANNVEEVDKYINALSSKITGLETTILYLKEHRKRMIKDERDIL